jgi:hypothetical protein
MLTIEDVGATHFSLAHSKGVRVCPAYLNELVILSNGDVTTCCADAKGENTLGNCYEMTLLDLWEQIALPWHYDNIRANLEDKPWQSSFCNQCFAGKWMTAFGVKETTDYNEFQRFHQQTTLPFPKSLVIEPVAACNYRCWGCYTGLGEVDRAPRVLKFDRFIENIIPVIPHLSLVRLYNYGETFLHPQAIEIMGALRVANPQLMIDVSTNGVLMTPKISEAMIDHQVNYLTISFHGGHTQEGLMRYARSGPDINKIVENIRYLVEAKKRRGAKLPWIFAKSILFDWNDSEEEMADFLSFGTDLGVDFTGWDLNGSDPSHSSKRVYTGSPTYKDLQEKQLLQIDFYRRFPIWPN